LFINIVKGKIVIIVKIIAW